MNKKINIIKADGTTVNSDIICYLENLDTSKRYAYYTLNEISGTGTNSTVKIYVSKINQNNPSLDTAITDAEWDILKGYMSDALKGNSNEKVKYIPIMGDTLNSISERAIAMPTAYDYVNKQKGIYAEKIALEESSEESSGTTIEPAAPIETIEPAVEPTNEPAVEQQTVEPTPEVAPIAPVEANSEEPTNTPVEQVTPLQSTMVSEEDNNTTSTEPSTAQSLMPMDIADIEKKYDEMINSLTDLKNKEIEAAKRYNATIELSAMHNEQHANYVQNEQNKETVPTPENIPFSQPAPIEPTPVVPETPISNSNLETNWFDMPAN